MAFQAVPDCANIRLEGNIDNQLTINNFGFAISGGGITPTNLAAITSELAGWAMVSLAPQLNEAWTFQRCVGVDLSAVNGAVAVAGIATPGGVAGEAAPNNVAACVSLRTGFSGRSYRGRHFLPAIPNAAITLNTLDSTFMTNIQTIYADVIGPGSFLPGWEFVVISRQTGGVLRPTGTYSPVVSAGFTTPYVRSMRSREIGHGA